MEWIEMFSVGIRNVFCWL
uniref:Uncharacterized protein n=1 Tax=Arundo donax TaxID=35708 RepID=A0A0A8YZ69_ARUDO